MAFKKKKTSFVIALLFLLTAFVGMQTSGAALEATLVARAGGPYLGEECSSMLLNASGSYSAEGDPLTYRWNIEGSWVENGYYPYMERTWYDDFSGEIILEVSDGTNIATDTTFVTISNVLPQIFSIEGPSEVEMDTELFLLVNFFDGLPDPRSPTASLDTFTAVFSWDDGTSTELSLLAGEFSASVSHLYAEVGIYQIMITVVDDDGGEAFAEWDLMVGDISPVEAGPDGTINEGSMFLSTGYLADANSPKYTAMVDYYDGTEAQSLLLNPGNTFDLSHMYIDDGVYTLLVTVFNEDMEYGSDTAMVTVNNVPPSVESLSVSPSNPYLPGTLFQFTALFSDPGILDAHTVKIEWGDGTSTQNTVEAGITKVSGSHSYAKAGEYKIVVTVTDDDGGTANASMSVVVKSPTISTDAIRGIIIGLKIPKGLKNSLLSILENIPHLLKHHKIHAAIHQLQAFIHFVEAHSGKTLPRAQAKELIHTTRMIIDTLRTT
jgi:PKD repeat protein